MPKLSFFSPAPAPQSATELFVVRDIDSGRKMLVFDITEAGVRLEYDPADLPAIIEVFTIFRKAPLS